MSICPGVFLGTCYFPVNLWWKTHYSYVNMALQAVQVAFLIMWGVQVMDSTFALSLEDMFHLDKRSHEHHG